MWKLYFGVEEEAMMIAQVMCVVKVGGRAWWDFLESILPLPVTHTFWPATPHFALPCGVIPMNLQQWRLRKGEENQSWFIMLGPQAISPASPRIRLCITGHLTLRYEGLKRTGWLPRQFHFPSDIFIRTLKSLDYLDFLRNHSGCSWLQIRQLFL